MTRTSEKWPKRTYSEDLLIQAPTAERLEQLGWESLFAWDREDFGPDSLLGRRRLLDIVENFVLFDAGTGPLNKILARNHQVLGVNRVIARLISTDPAIRAEVAAGRLGVFWHTQGSGRPRSSPTSSPICPRLTTRTRSS